MQLVGPYRIVRALGSCQIGTVWAAVDAAGGNVTVAVLDAAVASDPKWRDAFSGTARGHARVGMKVLQDDFTAPAPWVAVAAGDGPGVELIFTALGQEYKPTPAPEPAAETAHPWAAPSPWGGAPTVPVSPVPVSPVSVPPAPAQPAAAQPAPAQPVPTDPFPAQNVPARGGPTPLDITGSVPYTDGPPGRGRARVWIGIVTLALLLPALVITLVLTLLRPAAKDNTPTTTSGSPSATQRAPFVTPAPGQPGIEPPIPGAWPTDWLGLPNGDGVRTVDWRDRGMVFNLPVGWECVPVAKATGFEHYTCGEGGRSEPIGGDLIIRTCEAPCDITRQAELRMAEEAWGLQWTSANGFGYVAHGKDVGGQPQYGIVFVKFWRSVPIDRLDRELVFRMTAPPERAGELQRIATSLYFAVG